MTGFGTAALQSEAAAVSVELKAVNNRYLKLNLKLPELATRYEPELEKMIRKRIARGSVQVTFRIRLLQACGGYQISQPVLTDYLQQLQAIGQSSAETDLTRLLELPGVITENAGDDTVLQLVEPMLSEALSLALDHFQLFRESEGQSMADDLRVQAESIAEHLTQIEAAAPQVVAEYRMRLVERIQKAIGEADVEVKESDVLREVALFADRCDINEEITRLKCHLEQFGSLLTAKISQGRKLEFLGQEIFREINTIGSKANNVGIAHHVVEMKAAVERIREVLQNVE